MTVLNAGIKYKAINLLKKKFFKKHNSHSRLTTIILVIIFAAGILLILYPSIANMWNSRKQALVVVNYEETVSEMTKNERSAMLKEAEAYNSALYSIGSSAMLAYPDKIDSYWNTLNVEGSGIMGYVSIEKLDVKLPIYHGTDPHTLSEGAGHLEGSSLPVGGISTHSVIVAHRGLPSSKMFTDLDKMEIGDIFTVTILDKVLTYEVDKISVVLPNELDNLYIEDGEDYCTLLTCTPYGINTHRLLVRGVRTENKGDIMMSSDAVKISSMTIVPTLAALILLVILICVVAGLNRKKRENKSK